jgi:hypothetical protein
MLAILLMWSMPSLLVLSVFLHSHHADTRPEKPEPKTGRIFPLNVHGTVVYLTNSNKLSR